ncbi:glycosyltransferase [Bradyrhizobium sp. CAR08]
MVGNVDIELKPRDRVYIYAARDPIHYSGSPYYFMQNLREVVGDRDGSFIRPIPLKRITEIPFSYLRWGMKAGTFEKSAFFFSKDYHEASVRGASIGISSGTSIISFTSLMAPSLWRAIEAADDCRLYVYRDATYLQLLEKFKYARTLTDKAREELIENETRLYTRARRVFVYDQVIRGTLIERYGVDEKKIFVTGRGLNMSRADFELACAMRDRRPVQPAGPMVLTIIGRDAARKGVPQIIEAMDALSGAEQARIRLRVVGPDPGAIPKRSYVDALGFVSNKRRLLEIIASSDVGVLMSSAEGGVPGSLREFTSLGVPCWVAWLPQYEGGLDQQVIFKEGFPLVPPHMTKTLRTILSHAKTDLVAKGRAGFGYVGWLDQAATVHRWMQLDR